MKKVLQMAASALLLLTCTHSYGQNTGSIVVKAGEPKATIQPTMWGIFFEDINQGADGGLYAELIKNRSFEFTKPLMGWAVQGKGVKEGDVLVINRKEENSTNPRFIRVNARNAARGDFNMVNEGFHGMGIKQGLRYDFSLMYRQRVPGVKIYVQLLNAAGQGIGDTVLVPSATDTGWHKQAVSFHATATELKATCRISYEGTGTIDLDMISLFPSDTWKNRPGGMRADMVQMLADMKPGFIRFPGGCIVEGFDLSQRYRWKNTIGPIEARQLIINRWNYEFAHRPAPDYFQTFGLGFYEYFQLAEDIGAEPLPILNCGMACQFNSAELVPLDELEPYVKDALDLIEFANGSADSQWGKIRASMGHPAPFHLKMMGIGNENWGPQYVERLKIFTRAIKSKYPDMKLVNSSGTDPMGERFDLLNGELRKMNADIIDEHYYSRPDWFMKNAKRYDSYPRNGAKVFAGEYAAQSDKTVSVDNRNNWLTALSEAAFMTGLERNADVVNMASYAPLFAHVDGWQWTPDLIWLNNLHTYGTPDYYVQKLYSVNKGTNTLSITRNNEVIAGQDSLYAAAALDAATNEVIIKLVNVSGRPQTHTILLEGKNSMAPQARMTVLQSSNPGTMNSFENPQQVAPKESMIAMKGSTLPLTLAPYSFTLVRVKI